MGQVQRHFRRLCDRDERGRRGRRGRQGQIILPRKEVTRNIHPAIPSVRNCPFWSLPLPCLGTCLLLVCTLLQNQETNTTNFSLKFKLQIRFFLLECIFLQKKSVLSRASPHMWPCV